MHRTIGLLIAVAAVAPAIAADKPPQAPPAVVQKLLDCRAITEPGQRLACMDAGVAALAGAVEKRDVVVADREQVKKARRGLFGLALPSLNLFGSGDDDDGDKADERGVINEIEATLTGARQIAGNSWRFVLDDGSIWVQSEARPLPRDPKAGMKIRIRRAAMGTYLANVDGQIAIRVRRINE